MTTLTINDSNGVESMQVHVNLPPFDLPTDPDRTNTPFTVDFYEHGDCVQSTPFDTLEQVLEEVEHYLKQCTASS